MQANLIRRNSCTIAAFQVACGWDQAEKKLLETLHGLRRSFGSLAEWLDIPTGIVSQIMGHKPSATAEKHYRVRPIDLLRQHHQRYEDWILEQAQLIPVGEADHSLKIVNA